MFKHIFVININSNNNLQVIKRYCCHNNFRAMTKIKILSGLFSLILPLLFITSFFAETTHAQGYDTGGTLDDPDRRVVLNNASDRKKTITQIVYIVDDGSPNGVRFIYQDSPETTNPGAGGSATPFMTNNSIGNSDLVRIHRIRVDSTGLSNFADIFPVDRPPISASNFADNLVGGTTSSADATIIRTGFDQTQSLEYDEGAGPGDTTPVQPYIDELINVVSITDMRSYWDLDTGALGSAGEDFDNIGGNVAPQRYVDIMYEDLFCCFDFIAISERWGNTPMAIAALDENGNILRRNSPGSEFEGDPNEDDKSFRVDFTGASQGDLYQWNTGIQNDFADDNGAQPQWISVFQIRQFYGGGLDNTETTAGQEGPGGTGSIVDLSTESPIPVFGYRIYLLEENGGDGKILSLESPRITFTGNECFRTLSSPFENLTYAQLLNEIWTQGSANSDYPGGDPNVYFYDISEPTGTGAYKEVADLDTPITPGEGFLVSVFQDDDFGIPGSFDKALNRIRGKENGDGPADVITPTINSTANGFTLLGNPYATPIDFDLITKSNLTNVAYVYDNAAADWVSSSPIPGIGDFNGLISPFQGFFVQTASLGTPSIEFNDDAKVPNQTATFFGKENSSPVVDYVRLQLEGEGLNTSTWIAFTDEGNADTYAYGDALQLTPYADDFAILANQKLDNTLLNIGVYPHPLRTSVKLEIPLYIETTKTGSFTLKATHLNLPISLENLVLYDREQGVEIPLNEDMEYQFEMNRAKKANLNSSDTLSCNLSGNDLAMAGSPNKAKASEVGTTRFVIRLASLIDTNNEIPVSLRLNQNYPNPFNPTTQITYQLPRQSDVRLEVFDMNGRQVATLVNQNMSAGTHSVNFDASDLSSGIYMYRLQAGSTVLTRKLTLVK